MTTPRTSAATAREDATTARALEAAGSVPDPEIPVVTLADLGIVRGALIENGRLVVELTPTYSGCPATDVIRNDVIVALRQAGFADADVRLVLAPPWTTDWISEEGRRKLRDYGIAPPARHAAASIVRFVRTGGGGVDRCRDRTGDTDEPQCPRCASPQVELLSRYGSTPCKSLYRCRSCLEPFDHFKPH